jgi:hypothetical protein
MKLAREVLRLKEEGWKAYNIARSLRMDYRTVLRVLHGEGIYEHLKDEIADEERPTSLLPFEPLDPEPPPTESVSIQFLKDARENPKIPWADRIKCALAVVKLESGGDSEGWVAPTDPVLWAEALKDAIEVQTPEVRNRLLASLKEEGGI